MPTMKEKMKLEAFDDCDFYSFIIMEDSRSERQVVAIVDSRNRKKPQKIHQDEDDKASNVFT